MAEELPNLGLLIKLLKMTTSSVDGEALIAIRKANEQLAKFGGDWEALLRGKVTVIGDPFAGLDQPAARDMGHAGYARSTPPPPPQPKAKPFQAGPSQSWKASPQPAAKPASQPTKPQPKQKAKVTRYTWKAKTTTLEDLI